MSSEKSNKEIKLSYQTAGVDIEQADHLVEDIKHIAKRTQRSGVLTGIGGFGALFELPLDRYQKPVLVSGTDGVGTKLKLALKLQEYDGIGIDLVAMCVNDIITLGAEPLFFLDYYATGKLNTSQAKSVLASIGKGCELAEMALIGGETAEMPGMYQADDFDLAGFCVGVVEKEQIIDGKNVKIGDTLIALASSGPHSNGYSLIRKVIEHCKAKLTDSLNDRTLGELLLTPTKIYTKAVRSLLQANLPIHAIAHITGGGLPDNLPRVLPANTKAIVDQNSWERPEIFKWLQKNGNIDESEMYHTFNMGIGMVLVVDNAETDNALSQLSQLGETAWVLGHIQSSNESKPRVEIK